MAENESIDVGGDGISKNAQKKLLKAEEAAKKKAAKDAEKLAKKASEPVKAGAAEDVEELDPTQYYENRIKMITALEVCACATSLILKFDSIGFRNVMSIHFHINFTTL